MRLAPRGRSLRARLEAELGAAESLDLLVAECGVEREELARREAAGEVDALEAEKTLAQIAAKASQAASGAAHRRRVAAALQEAVEAEDERQAVRRLDRAVATARGASQKAAAGSELVAAAVETLLDGVRKLEALRSSAAEASARAKELGADLDTREAATVDETEWTHDVAELIRFLQAGPHRPHADGAAHSAQQAVLNRQRDREEIEWAVDHDLRTPAEMLRGDEPAATLMIETRLREDLRPAARAELEARRERARESRSLTRV